MSAMVPCQGCGAALWEPIDGKWCIDCHHIALTLPVGKLTDLEVLSLDKEATIQRLAAELLELHIATGIDLDFWPVARRLISIAGQANVEPMPLDFFLTGLGFTDVTPERCDCGCHMPSAAMPKDARCCECTGYVPEVDEGVFT